MRLFAGAAALLLLLALAVGTWHDTAGTAPAAQAAPRDLFHALLAGSRDLGRLPSARTVSFLVVLHHPTPSSMRAARNFLHHAGIASSWQPGSDWMVVRGPAGSVARVFQVAAHSYVAPSGRRFYAAARDPVVPARLAGLFAETGHISSYPNRSADILPVAGLRPADLVNAYNMQPLRSRHLDGSGETIAFIEIDGFRQSDLNAFDQHFSLPDVSPTIAAGNPFLKVEGEADLDLEIAHEIAPKAKLVVYDCSSSCSDSELVQLESQAVKATPHGIISISLGACESAEGSGTARAEANVFSQADTLGESVFVASGDTGAYTCLEQNWGAAPSPQYIGASAPASDPTVTAVGGTSLSLNANSSWYREEAWQNAGATAGTGGGLSQFFTQPSWQRGPGVANSYNTGGHREVPDISADADPLTGAQVVIDGQLTQVGGTSQATPIWAGMTALINQYLRQQGLSAVGFLNPALYALAASRPAYAPFHDITVGTNLFYPTTGGYDLATGLGTPNAWNLARDLAAYKRGQS